MTRYDLPLGTADSERLRAYELFRETGVVATGAAGDVAEMRRIEREWEKEDEPLR